MFLTSALGCGRDDNDRGRGGGGLLNPSLSHSSNNTPRYQDLGAARRVETKTTSSTERPPTKELPAESQGFESVPESPRSKAATEDDPIAAAARALLEEGNPEQWAKASALGPEDLTIRVSSEVTTASGEVIGLAGFNLRNVHGFRDSPKCNLLAFELAFRAGFVVPLVGRRVGWGFPASDMLAHDASDGRITRRWAEVRRRPRAKNINLDRSNGHAFMVVGASAIGGMPGHVALVDWVDALDLTREGDLRRLSFLGWEANTREGARYSRMHWATTSAVPRARFISIYILELRAAQPGLEVVVLGTGPRNPTEIFNHEGSEVDES